MIKYNGEFDLNIYTQFKIAALLNNVDMTKALNSEVETSLEFLNEHKIKRLIYKTTETPKEKREVKLEDENHAKISDFADRNNLTIKEVIQAIMIDYVSHAHSFEMKYLDKVDVGDNLIIPPNLYLEEGDYLVIAKTLNYPKDFIDNDKKLQYKWEDVVSGWNFSNSEWYYIQSKKNENKKYWIPHTFIFTSYSFEDTLKEELEVANKIYDTIKTNTSYDHIYLAIEYLSDNPFKNIKVNFIIESNEDIAEVKQNFIAEKENEEVIELDEKETILKLYNIFKENDIGKVDRYLQVIDDEDNDYKFFKLGLEKSPNTRLLKLNGEVFVTRKEVY
ncbi:MAG: hypothetical protein ACOCV1_05500 [Bacillota bacterium]